MPLFVCSRALEAVLAEACDRALKWEHLVKTLGSSANKQEWRTGSLMLKTSTSVCWLVVDLLGYNHRAYVSVHGTHSHSHCVGISAQVQASFLSPSSAFVRQLFFFFLSNVSIWKQGDVRIVGHKIESGVLCPKHMSS